MKVRLIGDSHGVPNSHFNLARNCEATVHLGDVGFKYGYLPLLDSEKHKIVGGNHDNYPALVQYPHYLGNYGETFGGIFYVRGAWSIDKAYRVEGRDWWAEEELTYDEGNAAFDAYVKAKPSIVVTHDCPQFITNYRYGWTAQKSKTGMLLELMWDVHKPKAWFYGHHHDNNVNVIQGTTFRCIKDQQYLDIETDDWKQTYKTGKW